MDETWRWEGEDRGLPGGFPKVFKTVKRTEAMEKITYWKTAATCQKPRGSCTLCSATKEMCYFKERS